MSFLLELASGLLSKSGSKEVGAALRFESRSLFRFISFIVYFMNKVLYLSLGFSNQIM